MYFQQFQANKQFDEVADKIFLQLQNKTNGM